MRDQRGADELRVVPVPHPGVYFCSEPAAEKEEIEHGGERRICCKEKVCKNKNFLAAAAIFPPVIKSACAC
jgi:hypothetical protein